MTHPLTGTSLPVYVADYVVDYGTSTVMGEYCYTLVHYVVDYGTRTIIAIKTIIAAARLPLQCCLL